jgi:ferrochelatase
MSVGVLFINFGEPDEPTLEKVTPFLERIFLRNASLEGHANQAAAERARDLARGRAPGLMEAYRTIGGSPLNAQSEWQAEAFAAEWKRRGHRAIVYSAYQFTDPTVADAVARAKADGVDTLIAVPGYPLCGQSTTVAALEDVRLTMDALGWQPRFLGLSGWHHHAEYLRLRAEGIRTYVRAQGLDLEAPDTILYFSVHGTPLKYLREGNRYDRYVVEHCRDLALALGTRRYAVGFQNHTNRRIPWTQPDNEVRIRALAERRLVIVPISFMKEQSETLSELDHEVRAFVEGLGKECYRVPVPHADPGLAPYMADLVEGLLSAESPARQKLSRCRCCTLDDVWCTNGTRDLPPSPFATEA